MMRAELLRRLHEARVEAIAQWLFAERPRGPLTTEQEERAWREYRERAERFVTEREQRGLDDAIVAELRAQRQREASEPTPT